MFLKATASRFMQDRGCFVEKQVSGRRMLAIVVSDILCHSQGISVLVSLRA